MFTRCAECSHVPKHVQWAAACKSVMWKVTNLWPQITWRWAANNGYKHCSALPSAFWKAPSPTRHPGQEGTYKSTRVGKHGVCFPSAEQGARPAKCHSTGLAAATLCNEAMFTSLVWPSSAAPSASQHAVRGSQGQAADWVQWCESTFPVLGEGGWMLRSKLQAWCLH